MTRRTEGVKALIQEVLEARFMEPYDEDVTLEVFLAIEDNNQWNRRYQQLCNELTRDTVNQWGGRYVKELTGLNSIREVPAEEGHIIRNYTKLGRRRR